MPRAALIVNPLSGNGRAQRALPEVRAALEAAGHETTVLITDSRGAARRLATEAAHAGCDALLTLGGDGTLSEAVDGVLAAGGWPDGVTITPLPLGTGNSFVRHFGPRSGEWRAALDRLLAGRRRWVDAAQIHAEEMEGQYMVNVFGCGFMAHAADAANRHFKWLGGASYTLGVLWRLVRQQSPPTRLMLGGEEPLKIDEPISLVAVCNTQWTGEEMWMAPEADVADGLLDVLVLRDISRIEHLRLFPKIFSGTHVRHPAVTIHRACEVRIEPRVPSPLLVDGEVLGRTPVTVRVVPRAVQVAL